MSSVPARSPSPQVVLQLQLPLFIKHSIPQETKRENKSQMCVVEFHTYPYAPVLHLQSLGSTDLAIALEKGGHCVHAVLPLVSL